MKPQIRHILTLGILYISNACAYAQIEPTVEKTFSVQPGGELRLDTQSGSIRLQHSTDNTIKIIATQRLQPDIGDDADKWTKKHTLTIEQNNNNIIATATCGKPPGFVAGGGAPGTWPPVIVDFTVTLPPSWSVNLITGAGNIEVCDLAGAVLARTSAGNIKIGNIQGKVTATAREGNVALLRADSSATLQTASGSIIAEHISGPAILKTSNGNIEARHLDNTLQAIITGRGDLKAFFANAIQGECALAAADGRVSVSVDKSAAFALEAKSTYGKVRVAEALAPEIKTGGQAKHRLTAIINGGGPNIKITNTDKDISVDMK